MVNTGCQAQTSRVKDGGGRNTCGLFGHAMILNPGVHQRMQNFNNLVIGVDDCRQKANKKVDGSKGKLWQWASLGYPHIKTPTP